MIVARTCFLSLLFLHATASTNTLRRRDEDDERGLQVPEVCGYTPKWDWEGDGYKHPVVPCTSHSDCFDFSDSGSGWGEPCCLFHDCLCGSVQSLFTPGVLHCGRFACTMNDECWPGNCINGQCNFDNIPPCCTTAADCGSPSDWACIYGSCYEIDENGFHRPSKECNRQETSAVGRSPGTDGGDGSKKGMGKRRTLKAMSL